VRAVDISVIVTNFNYGRLLRRCLRSLLNQDLERDRYEIIVVDDHSTDDSREALAPFLERGDVRAVFNEENLGVGASSRIGVDESRGKFFVRVDADDYVQPSFLYMLYNFLRLSPQHVGVSCDYFLTDNQERILSVKSFAEDGLACGLMLRTSYLEIIGSYNKDMKIFEDKDLVHRIDAKKIYHLPLPLYNYVKHGESLTDRVERPAR
jgi:glycosyltransferase involved in cell wall biosynthesis